MFLFLFAACDTPDLPEGWEDAERIEDFTQAACDQGDTGAPVITGEQQDGDVALTVGPVGFRCAQDVEGYWMPTGDAGASVLVQPIDMNPTSVAKCDCLYDLALTIPTATPVTMEVYKRWDRHGDDDPQPVAIGTVEVQ
jgi:hypothetical protein